jgi:phosphoribosylformimino-5-aminoimidazole carboxamide ribotide isomerase
VPFIQEYQKNGIQYVVCTDISKDGMLQGPSVDLHKKIINQCTNGSVDQSVKLIASGGVTTIEDVEVLSEIGCDGVIIGKAIYENRISLKELERFL